MGAKADGHGRRRSCSWFPRRLSRALRRRGANERPGQELSPPPVCVASCSQPVLAPPVEAAAAAEASGTAQGGGVCSSEDTELPRPISLVMPQGEPAKCTRTGDGGVAIE